jgi:hypothetical protein
MLPRIALYSPSVGKKDHGSGCTPPTCALLAERQKYRPLLISGQAKIADGATYDHIILPVDHAREDAHHFQRFGRFAKLIRGLHRVCTSIRSLGYLRRYLKRNPDIKLLHYFEYEQLALSWCALVHGRLAQRFCITVYQADYDSRLTSLKGVYMRISRRFFERVLRRAAAIIVYGEFTRERLLSQMRSLSPDKVFAIRLHPSASSKCVEKSEARAKLRIPPDVPVVLIFGLLRRNKNISLISRVPISPLSNFGTLKTLKIVPI